MDKRIKYETIYNEFEYNDSTKNNKFKLRKKIKTILDEWKGSKVGAIKFIDYQEIKRGLLAYEIDLEYKIARK